MQYKDNTTKKVIAVFIAIALVIVVSAGTAFLVARTEAKKVQKNLVATIKGDLGEYLSDYVAVQTGTEGEITPDNGEITLTQEQIDAIVESVSSTIEYSLIKDTISKYSSVSEESLAALKASLSEQINKVLDSNEETKDLTAEEKESIVNTVSTIVKYDMLDMMKEYEANNAADIQLLRESMNKDISELKTTLKTYEEKFTTLQNSINALDKESAEKIANLSKENNEKITDLQNAVENLEQNYSGDTTSLTEKYEVLSNQYTTIAKSVEYLEKLNIEPELSDIKKNVETNKNDINTLVNLLNENFASLNNELAKTQNSLGTQIASTNSALQNYTKNATEEAKAALQKEIEATKAALAQEMQGASAEQQKNLQSIYDELSAAQTNLENSNMEMSVLEAALNQNVANINSSFEAYKESVQKQINATNSNLDTLSQTLAEASKSLAGDIESNREKMTASLQKASNELQANIDQLGLQNAGALVDLKQDIDKSLENLSKGTATKEELDALNSKITEVTGSKITELKTELNEKYDSKFIEVNGKIADNATAISNLNSTMSTNNQTLTQAITDLQNSTNAKNTEIDNSIKDIQDNITQITNILEKKAVISYKVVEGKATLSFSDVEE